jgi:hypothetical protein
VKQHRAQAHRQGIIRGVLWAAGLAQAMPAARAQVAPPPADPAPAAAYEFGRGLRLGDSGFTLGGYATLEYRHEQGVREQFKSGHASAFVWWEGLERVKVFAEIDALNVVSHQHRDDYDDARRISLERLYGDYSFSDALTVRLGKFLTPIGRWNLIHAEPLVWTTSSPWITQTVFPRNVTGAAASGQWHGGGQTVAYTVFASNGSEWRADRWADPFSHVRGLRLSLPVAPDLVLGLSLANYELDSYRGESRRLRGLDIHWSHRRYEVSAEWLRTNRLPVVTTPPGSAADRLPLYDGYTPGGDRDPGPATASARRTQGGFVQAVAPIGVEWFLVVREEYVDESHISTALRRHVAGLTWRPNAATAFKLEWAQAEGLPPGSGRSLASSLSVLF